MMQESRRQAMVFTDTQARSMADQLASSLGLQAATIANLATRHGAILRDQKDLSIDLVGMKLMFWVDPPGKARWVLPRTADPALLATDFAVSEAVVRAARSGKSETGRSGIPGSDGERLVEVAAPIVSGEKLAGYVVAVFSPRETYAAVLSTPANAPGWSVALIQDGREVYRRGSSGAWLAEVPVPDLAGSSRIRIAPAPEFAARIASSLPDVVLATGAVISLLLGAAIHFARASRRRAEEARESEQRYRAFFESHVAGAVVTDAKGSVLEANPAALEMLGVSAREELQGRSLPALHARLEDGDDLMERITAQERVDQVELELRRPDGRPVTVLANLTARRDREGRLTEIHAFLLDITEKKRMEAQLRQAQKMDAIGRLAGGVAHDFNNLLGVITGYAELLEKDLPPRHSGHRRLKEIRRAADSATALTHQLLTFSRKQPVEPRVVDLNEIVPGAERMLQRLIGEDIELVAALAPDLGSVRADPGQIEQLILNLAINARDAMPNGGRLIIETANVALGPPYALTHPGVEPGPYVMLAVSDNGAGMDAETLSHAFEPFFTTKEQGKGTGLGLATVYGIVQQCGGTVDVYSEVGHGTSFKIYLPRVGAAEPRETAAPVPPDLRGSETILLFEDSDPLREMICEILEESGYRVIQAETPEASLRALAEHGPSVDLLVTDVIMPGMGGPALAARLQASNPRARVLYISGYTNETVGSRGGMQVGTKFLQKPFTFEALLRKVREVLDAEPSPVPVG
jgi:PAS domain S-box-containing protein